MIDLDRNYLDHNFIFDENFIYTCSICKVKVKYILPPDESDYIVRIITTSIINGKSFSVVMDSFNNLTMLGDILTLTCDEMVIKNIIE